MNTKKSVFSKLFGKKSLSKTELKSLKVDLSIVDDLEGLYDSLDQSFSEASYYANERLDELTDQYFEAVDPIKTEIDEMAINGSARFLEENSEEVKALIIQLNEKAADLGIDPRDLVANYDELNEMSLSGQMVYDELLSKYRETIGYTGNNTFLS